MVKKLKCWRSVGRRKTRVKAREFAFERGQMIPRTFRIKKIKKFYHVQVPSNCKSS